MNSQLYTAASGLVVEGRRVEQISHNLANVRTSGFRAQRTFSAVFQQAAADADPMSRVANKAVALAGSYEVPGPGPTRMTGRMLDVALAPDNVLGVETANGKRYSRAGGLSVTAEGALVDPQGNPVLNDGGKPIRGLSPAAVITPDGRITDKGQVLGRLLILRDPSSVLRPQGDNLLTDGGNERDLEKVKDAKLMPGWLEGSASDPLGEMVRLVEAQRAFQGYQKLISLTMNEINRRAVNELAG